MRAAHDHRVVELQGPYGDHLGFIPVCLSAAVTQPLPNSLGEERVHLVSASPPLGKPKAGTKDLKIKQRR